MHRGSRGMAWRGGPGSFAHGPGPERLIETLQELRHEIAQLRHEVMALRGERGPGARGGDGQRGRMEGAPHRQNREFRGPPDGRGRRGPGEHRGGPHRDGPPAGGSPGAEPPAKSAPQQPSDGASQGASLGRSSSARDHGAPRPAVGVEQSLVASERPVAVPQPTDELEATGVVPEERP
jgi:hypothetical protein